MGAADDIEAALKGMGMPTGTAPAGTAPKPAAAPRPGKPAAAGGRRAPRTAKAKPAPAARAVAPIKRANGTTYYPREIGGAPDVTVLRVAAEHGIHVLLSGRPGTGKTSLVSAAFEEAVVVRCTNSTRSAAFLGEWVPGDAADSFRWRRGALVDAASRGVPLFVDDFTLVEPDELAAVYSAMDGTGWVADPDPANESGMVPVKEGFVVVGGHNPGAKGTYLDDPLRSRFGLHVEIPTDYDLAKSMGVPETMVKVAKRLAADRDDPSEMLDWAPEMREMLAFARVESAFGTEAAVRSLVAGAPDDAREYVVDVAAGVFGIDGLGPLRSGGQL